MVGEGEQTLYEIVEQKQKKISNNNLPGVAYRINGHWESLSRSPIDPLDKVYFPDYRNFDLKQYLSKKSILVEWSRGCLGQCSFCKNYRLVAGYRRKSPEVVLKELSFLVNNYGIDTFTVCDNLMNGDILQLKEVCALIIKNNLKINWSGQIAPRTQMQDYLFRQMYLAGCFKVQVGVESGSQKVLKLMKKPYSPQVAAKNLKAAKQSGLETEIFLLVGFPGESEMEFKKTLNFVKKNHSYIDTIKSINTLHLIAGTQIYENPGHFNLEPLPKNDWHYLWQTKDGNTYAIRKERVQQLLDLAVVYGIKVQETNIKEGKELFLIDSLQVNDENKILDFKNSLHCIQPLPSQRQFYKKTRSLGKWVLLFLSTGFIFFYIAYFWFLMALRKKIILGGKKE